MLVGTAIDHALSNYQRKGVAVTVIAALILAHNFTILWFRKRSQFQTRAAQTERIIQLARQTPNPILVRCFTGPGVTLSEAVHIATGRPPSDVLFSEAEAAGRQAADFCYDATSR
jgi:hypothetical protein